MNEKMDSDELFLYAKERFRISEVEVRETFPFIYPLSVIRLRRIETSRLKEKRERRKEKEKSL